MVKSQGVLLHPARAAQAGYTPACNALSRSPPKNALIDFQVPTLQVWARLPSGQHLLKHTYPSMVWAKVMSEDETYVFQASADFVDGPEPS